MYIAFSFSSVFFFFGLSTGIILLYPYKVDISLHSECMFPFGETSAPQISRFIYNENMDLVLVFLSSWVGYLEKMLKSLISCFSWFCFNIKEILHILELGMALYIISPRGQIHREMKCFLKAIQPMIPGQFSML